MTEPTPAKARADLLRVIAARLPDRAAPVLLGIDGVDGAGKSVFANQLAAVLADGGRRVIRASVDDFHQPRALRWQRGRHSAAGFWLDSFDYRRLRSDLLDPLQPGGSRQYRTGSHDLATDQYLELPWQQAPDGAVLVLDGLFLHRPELAGYWDLSVLLDVPVEISVARLALRDGSPDDPEHPALARYVGAQRHYFDSCQPRQRASLVVDNSDWDAPELSLPPVTADPGDLTLAGYQLAAQRYADQLPQRLPAELADYLDRLAGLVGDGPLLELGSGTGAVADYLAGRGAQVQRSDATPAFLDLMRAAGHQARRLDLRTDDLGGPYRAILANAVLLHLTRAQFEDALRRSRQAVIDGGWLAITLKDGDGEGWSDARLGVARHFTYWREPELRAVLSRTGWTVHSLDQVAGRIEPWLYLIARAT